MRAAEVSYANEEALQGGAIIIERPSHGDLKRAMSDNQAATDIQNIGFRAYMASGWVQEIAARQGIGVAELAARAFYPGDPVKLGGQFSRVKESSEQGRRVEYWFAEHIEPMPDPLPEDASYFDYTRKGYPHGFAKIEQIGANRHKAVRYGQYVSRLGIQVCLHDINVLPEKQGKGLAVALGYVGLKDQPSRLKSSLITAANNTPMRTYAEQYGYREAGEFSETGLFDGISVPFVRYEAPNVRLVLEHMEDRHPWLANGEAVSMLARIFREDDDEMLSMNPRGG